VVERDDLTNRKDDLETRIEEIKKQLKAHEEELVIDIVDWNTHGIYRLM
jgi:hypothetical protein